MGAIMVGVALVSFTSLSGQTVLVNPSEVVVLRRQAGKGLLTENAQCVIGTTDAKFITVKEDCDTVQHKLRGE